MSSSEILETLAQDILDKTLAKVKETDRYSIDPLTIIILIGIAVNVIRVIQECNKNKTTKLKFGEKVDLLSTDIKFRSNNHSFFTRLKIRSIIKKHLNSSQYKVYKEPLLQTLLEIGKKVKEEQVSALLEHENV